MKRNVFAMFLAMALVVALLFVVAPATRATVADHTFTADNESWNVSEDCVIDLAGFDVTIEVTNDPTVVVIDSKNLEDLTGNSAGSLKISGSCTIETINLVDDYRYLKMENEDGTYSFHPFNMSITQMGIGVTKPAVSLEAKFIANDVVRDYIKAHGEFGIKNITEGHYEPLSGKYSFPADKNGVVARYSLDGSLAESELNTTKNFCAYVKIDGVYYDGKQNVAVKPATVLGYVNAAFASYNESSKALAMQLYNENAYLQKYLPAMGPDVELTIGSFANGTVTADKASYKVGDTITLTVAPAKNYAQKLYLNGQPILVDTNSKYSFVAEEGKTYAVTGEFVSTSGKWYWTADYGLLNQGHGVLYAPAVAEKNGELVPTADKCYGGRVLVTDPSKGAKQDYAVVLKMQFSDGQKAEVRVVNKDGKGAYMLQSMSGMFGSWKWYYDMTPEENAAIANGEGVWFGMVREGTTVKLSINGSVKQRNDVTVNVAEDVVLNQFKVTTYNFNYAVNLAYEFYMIDNSAVKLNVGSFANGTVSTDKASYKAGDTVTLTVAPDKNYAQKLYLNGQPILVDTNGKYSFVAEEGKTYAVTGEFVSTSGKWFWIPDNFNMINQGHNIALAKAGSTGELVPTADKCYGGKVLVKDPSQGTQKEYAVAFKMHFANGQKAEVRLIGEKGDGKYRLQVLGNNILGNWAGIYNLSDAENAAVKSGDGVWFSMVREGTKVSLLINDNVVKTYDLSANGITADTKISQFKLQAYNLTVDTNIPYEFYIAQ